MGRFNKLAASNKNLKKGFIIAGILLGFVLPMLLMVCRENLPASFYISENFILKNLGMILSYAYSVSIYLYAGLFICSVIYTEMQTTAVIALPFVFYNLVNMLYMIVTYNSVVGGAFWTLSLFIIAIILMPVLWYLVIKLISLIKMPDAAKIIISAIPVFIIMDWTYVWDITALLINDASGNMTEIISILSNRLVPFVLCMICAAFLYVIMNDIVNRKEIHEDLKKKSKKN